MRRCSRQRLTYLTHFGGTRALITTANAYNEDDLSSVTFLLSLSLVLPSSGGNCTQGHRIVMHATRQATAPQPDLVMPREATARSFSYSA
jgi:hypothetical protein